MLQPEIHPELKQLLACATQSGASDVHWSPGQAPLARIAGILSPLAGEALAALPSEAAPLMALLTEAQRQRLSERGAVDGAFSIGEQARWRFNIYRTQGRLAAAFRRLHNQPPSLAALGLPERLYEVCESRAGLVLAAGPTGSGKSTTLASLIDFINRHRPGHVMTLEDPIEYLHRPQAALITQRQIGWDAPDFHQALMDALRQDPDVILVGEIRDLNTIRTAVTAAETGHLVLASVHAADCVGAIERLISVFPGEEQPAIQHLLSMTLRTIIAQHLVPARETALGPERGAARTGNEGAAARQRVLVSEVLHATPAVSNLISQMSLKQIPSAMETGAAHGMYTMDQCLAGLLRRRSISEGTARGLARNPQLVADLARRSDRSMAGVS